MKSQEEIDAVADAAYEGFHGKKPLKKSEPAKPDPNLPPHELVVQVPPTEKEKKDGDGDTGSSNASTGG